MNHEMPLGRPIGVVGGGRVGPRWLRLTVKAIVVFGLLRLFLAGVLFPLGTVQASPVRGIARPGEVLNATVAFQTLTQTQNATATPTLAQPSAPTEPLTSTQEPVLTVTPSPEPIPTDTPSPSPTATSLPTPTPTETLPPTSVPTEAPLPSETPQPTPRPTTTPPTSFDVLAVVRENWRWTVGGCGALSFLLVVLLLIILRWRRWRSKSAGPPAAPRAEPPLGPHLLGSGPSGNPVRLSLKPGGVTIGRAAGNDLTIGEEFTGWETVSQQHARLYRRGERWIVEDLGSLNGVWVNGKRTGRNLLQDGWTVDMGGVKFTFHADAEETGP